MYSSLLGVYHFLLCPLMFHLLFLLYCRHLKYPAAIICLHGFDWMFDYVTNVNRNLTSVFHCIKFSFCFEMSMNASFTTSRQKKQNKQTSLQKVFTVFWSLRTNKQMILTRDLPTVSPSGKGEASKLWRHGERIPKKPTFSANNKSVVLCVDVANANLKMKLQISGFCWGVVCVCACV